jgi:hypothetical protein
MQNSRVRITEILRAGPRRENADLRRIPPQKRAFFRAIYAERRCGVFVGRTSRICLLKYWALLTDTVSGDGPALRESAQTRVFRCQASISAG